MKTPQAALTEPAPEGGQTWSIADVERDTGLGKDTLRVWERRYGFPAPGRDNFGERIYPDDQVQRLRLIKRLMDAGFRPGKIVSLAVEELQSLFDEGMFPSSGAGGTSHTYSAHPIEDADVWIEWLTTGRTDLIKQKLQQQILRTGLGNVVEQLIAPLCVLVGDAWLRGELSVYQEHLFSEILQSVLREGIAAVDSINTSDREVKPRVLLTTTPNEQHGMGLLMAECFFALESCERFVLGTSTPIAEIVQATHHLKIDVLALSFSAHAARRYVVESLRQLRDQLPDHVEIWVGGAGVSRRMLPEGVMALNKPGEVSSEVAAWRRRHTT